MAAHAMCLQLACSVNAIGRLRPAQIQLKRGARGCIQLELEDLCLSAQGNLTREVFCTEAALVGPEVAPCWSLSFDGSPVVAGCACWNRQSKHHTCPRFWKGILWNNRQSSVLLPEAGLSCWCPVHALGKHTATLGTPCRFPVAACMPCKTTFVPTCCQNCLNPCVLQLAVPVMLGCHQ